jgi:hypothetical protein
VTRWLLACFPREEIEKKPFNPTIGEQHLGWIEYPTTESQKKEPIEGGDKKENEVTTTTTTTTTDEQQPACDWTEMFAEQVSHHPPLSAFFLRNSARDLSLHGTLDFQVSFGGANHVNITSGGGARVQTRYENYTLSKLVPNLTIQRVIFGVKYYMWMGPLVMEAMTQSGEQHAYRLDLQFSEKNESTNRIKGTISLRGVPLYFLSGSVGRVIHYWKAESGAGKDSKLAKSAKSKKARMVLFDFAKYLHDESNVKYPAPEWYEESWIVSCCGYCGYYYYYYYYFCCCFCFCCYC